MSRVIDAVFRLKDEFTKPMKNCITALTDVGREGKRARKQVENVGKSIAGAGQTMTASLTTPIIGLGAASYSTFEGVNKQLNLVKATMGETNYATADLSAALKDAAVNSIFTMEEGAGALVNFARQGFNAAEAADMLAPSMNLAAGTATDLDSVTSGLGNTLKAFGASSEEATHYADMFAQAQAQANTDVQGLFDAMSVAGPIAQTVGWQFEDIGALIGVFGDASIGATEGATALKTGLARLASPAKAGAEAMERLGMDSSALFNEDGGLKSMPEVIGALQNAFSGLTTEQQLASASAIFGKNQMSNWLALINGPGQETLQGLRDNIAAASGNAQEAANAMVTPTERLKSTFDVFKETVGELLADKVVPLIDKATELIDTFRQMDTSQQQQIIRFAGMAAAAGPMVFAFGKAVMAASKLAGVFAAVHKAGNLLKFGFAALTSPAGLVIAVLAGIVAAGVLIYKNWDTIKQKAEPVFGAIKTAVTDLQPSFEAFKTAMSGLKETLDPIVEAIGTALATAFGALATAVGQSLATKIGTLSTKLKKVLDTGTDLINFINNVFKKDWGAAWESIGSAFDTAFGPVVTTIQSAIDKLGSLKTAASEKWDASAFNPSNWFGDTPRNAGGTNYWRGGPTRVGESGGEIINLSSGTQIIPHDASRNTPVGSGGVSIAKLADTIVVREDADIDRITDALVRKLRDAKDNMGQVQPA